MASIENKCFKLDHARSSIRLIQDHDFDINYKTRNRNPDSETRFEFRIKKMRPMIFLRQVNLSFNNDYMI